MIIKLGGPPDEDVEENNRLLDAFEKTSKGVKENLNECKDMLKIYINKSHDSGWLSSNDRAKLDEDIKSTFKATEAQIAFLSNVLKKYQKKNRQVLKREHFEGFSKQIDLLRKNLNLLQDEFKVQ